MTGASCCSSGCCGDIQFGEEPSKRSGRQGGSPSSQLNPTASTFLSLESTTHNVVIGVSDKSRARAVCDTISSTYRSSSSTFLGSSAESIAAPSEISHIKTSTGCCYYQTANLECSFLPGSPSRMSRGLFSHFHTRSDTADSGLQPSGTR